MIEIPSEIQGNKNYLIGKSIPKNSGLWYRGQTIEDQVLGELVDIKVITNKYLNENPKSRAEFEIMAHLNSEQFIKLYEVIQQSDYTFLVFEYCESNLQKYIDQRNEKIISKSDGERKKRINFLGQQNHLQKEEALNAIKQILTAYLQLIEKGIVHRNLRLESILIKDLKNKNYKIADFGTSRKLFGIGTDGQEMETIHDSDQYSSPQFSQNKGYTTKCDIWSIGVMFFVLNFGFLPYIKYPPTEGSNEDQDPFNREEFKDYTLDPNVKDFIKGCLKYEEKDRFSWFEVYSHKLFQETNLERLFLDLRVNPLKDNSQAIKLLLTKINGVDEFQYPITLSAFREKIQENDKNITRQNISKMFCLIDYNCKGEITKEVLQSWMNRDNFNYKISDIQNNSKLACVFILERSMKKFSYLPKQCFDLFAGQGSKKLNLLQFISLMKSIDDSISEESLRLGFEHFTQKQSDFIELGEFEKELEFESFEDQALQQTS